MTKQKTDQALEAFIAKTEIFKARKAELQAAADALEAARELYDCAEFELGQAYVAFTGDYARHD